MTMYLIHACYFRLLVHCQTTESCHHSGAEPHDLVAPILPNGQAGFFQVDLVGVSVVGQFSLGLEDLEH